ncbi:class I SAM-dependent DNA methyltransferase [Dyadobacter sp. CY323]|uniref:HsdM family class I SAM-dependent methyltransferase n=1 Tax=Dyadobacter sp. CY323 TaxID=2907302 RepID=UPI001F424DC4|nr:N-6 DNA methylase [Dyadobacter sp. CY323]MCE6990000.1 N-6 DNA methylase [Dyadobacter sp. CY323]
MASQNRSYEKKKLLGQVYTPLHIVQKILTHCGFYNLSPAPITILDPACGDGRFLVPIAEYLIQNSPADQLSERLGKIEGWDIDPEAIKSCRKNLDHLVADLGLEIQWKLEICDALKQRDSGRKFDLIVGNPPYIRIQHLPEEQRKYIQKEYSFCQSGSTDAFVAFFELASELLTENGHCGFITPNSYLTSETGRALRSYFECNQNLLLLTNFAHFSVFKGTSTYAAVTIFGKIKNDAFFFEQCRTSDFQYNGRNVSYSELRENQPWHLAPEVSQEIAGERLGDICKISVGVTTLADPYYLFSIISKNDDLVYARNKNGMEVYLEKAILKPIVKGSKLKTSQDPITEYILFPYKTDESGKQRIIPQDELESKFPETFSYFLKVKPALDRRDNGKPNAVAWYAFGRSQSLDSSFGKKIIFSPMNLSPNFVLHENEEATVYSGYFIKYDGDYETLLTQLNSQRMADFIAVAGRDFQGGYKGYNKKAIENFVITKD